MPVRALTCEFFLLPLSAALCYPKPREIPEPGPTFVFSALGKQNLLAAQYNHGGFVDSFQRCFFPVPGQIELFACAIRAAEGMHRTLAAARIARRAELGAQFHQGLIEAACATAGEHFCGGLPEAPLSGRPRHFFLLA